MDILLKPNVKIINLLILIDAFCNKDYIDLFGLNFNAPKIHLDPVSFKAKSSFGFTKIVDDSLLKAGNTHSTSIRLELTRTKSNLSKQIQRG